MNLSSGMSADKSADASADALCIIIQAYSDRYFHYQTNALYQTRPDAQNTAGM